MKAQVLINNAGISQFDAIHNISETQFRQAMEVNLLAPMCLTRDFLQLETGHHKTVVNVGSALGSIGFPFYSSYCASKFGLRGFSEALSRELAQSDDNILYFAPRATQTPMNTEAVNAMNRQFGNAVDSPQAVALALVNQLEKGTLRAGIGWPEQIFAKVNALLPQLVDSILSKKLKNISQFVRSH
ncbi:MAG: SDR family NAD(P)-dependent oxidoreductase [Algicola sp.]|nr:SDR family NAD(P)-dependent oxidoreductase [Algicola sp.]